MAETLKAVGTVQVDTDTVRVTEYRFQPGAATGYHRHEYPYVVVPMTDGALRLVGPSGTSEGILRAGQAYARPAGVEHDVINASAHEVTFVEVEMKR